MEREYERSIPTERSEEDILQRKEEFRKLCLKVEGRVGNLRYYINPLTTLVGAVILWGIIGWAIADKAESIQQINEARTWITDKCTWLYVGSHFIWAILVFVIYFKFGHIKLGLASDYPEYGNFDYMAMIFTTGICNGLFYDSAHQPIVGFRNTTDNLLLYRGKDNHISKAQNSLNVVLFHWGFHGFAVYVLPSLLMSVLAYRKGLPLTIRSCFYPVFGKKIFGRLGDVVDSIAIVCMGFGLSTSFMLGTLLLITGIHTILPDLFVINETSKIITLWCVCLFGMISASTGIRLGIRRMSQLCFLTGVFFTITVAFSDNIWYLLNLTVQSIGYYAQFIIGTSTFTGAFLQQGTYPGATEDEVEWMHSNTVFYWGWWLGWAPLVSMFMTRISKGRTIKNVITYSFLIPSVLNFIWFVVIGGVALDIENRALSLQLDCNSTNRPASIPDWIQRIECVPEDFRFYVVAQKYEDITLFLEIVAVIITVLYFVTSYDSAALVMSSICSNGDDKPPLIQRMFWCITIGATTTVIITYEDTVNKDDVTAFAIIAGLPFAIVMCFVAVALWRLLEKEPNWSYELLNQWQMTYGNINSKKLLWQSLLAIIAPWYFLGNVCIREKELKRFRQRVIAYLQFALPFYLWIILLLMRVHYKNVDKIAWATFVGFLMLAATIRRKLRERHGIEGNIVEDVALMAIFPLTSVQMHEQYDRRGNASSNTSSTSAGSLAVEELPVIVGRGGGVKMNKEVFFNPGFVDDNLDGRVIQHSPRDMHLSVRSESKEFVDF